MTRSIAPFTATCAAVMGASDAAFAKTPRYHPAIDRGSALESCTQILNVISGTARDSIAVPSVSAPSSSSVTSRDRRYPFINHIASLDRHRASRAVSRRRLASIVARTLHARLHDPPERAHGEILRVRQRDARHDDRATRFRASTDARKAPCRDATTRPS